MTSSDSLTYKAAGVDIDAGDELVERIKRSVARTTRPEVLGGLGGFGGLFRLPIERYRDPVLVAGTDGVGTKLKLAIDHDAHDEIGIDLVAMCANDVIVQGAEPLFFLDYFVTPKLNVDIAARVIDGIARGCEQAGAALIGGETAEHPGMHVQGEYDLAGFCVGVVEHDRLLDGRSIRNADEVIGLQSSGPHSNGFSLIRKILEGDPDAVHGDLCGRPLIEHLLAPTRIYVSALKELLAGSQLKGLAHITGGGLIENLPRVLPDGLGVRLRRAAAWSAPPVFDWLRRAGVAETEMLRTFNCGIGMAAFVAPDHTASVLETLRGCGQPAEIIGTVVDTASQKVILET